MYTPRQKFEFLTQLHDDLVVHVLSYVAEAPFERIEPQLCE